MKNKLIRGITTLFTIILTATLGRIQYGNHTETWYNAVTMARNGFISKMIKRIIVV